MIRWVNFLFSNIYLDLCNLLLSFCLLRIQEFVDGMVSPTKYKLENDLSIGFLYHFSVFYLNLAFLAHLFLLFDAIPVTPQLLWKRRIC